MIGKYLILLVTIGTATALQQIIPVTIYYESLCPDSMKFITDQVIPTYNDLKNYLRLELVPFGKSNWTEVSADNIIFNCHHQMNECDGNKYQSCLIDPSSNVNLDDQMMFLNCLMKDQNREQKYDARVQDCSTKTTAPSVNVQQLNRCAQGIQGSNLLRSNGQKTNRAQNPLKSVPSVAFANANPLDEAESKKAVDSFRSSVCGRIIENPKPKACEGSGAPITTVGLITLFATGLVVRML